MNQIENNMKKARDVRGEIAKEDNVKEVQTFIRELLQLQGRIKAREDAKNN